MLQDSLNPNPCDAPGQGRKLHLNCGHATPNQSKRILVDVGRPDTVPPDVAEDVADQFTMCRALDNSPLLPVDGAPGTSAVNQGVQVDLPCGAGSLGEPLRGVGFARVAASFSLR